MFVFVVRDVSVFFVKQKTAYEMRISDWSSDVCSSDLAHPRFGDLGAAAAIGEAWVSEGADGPAFNFDLSRTGDRSVYGDIEVTRPGIADPLLVARGIAVYPEVTARTVSLRVPDDVAAKLKGPVRIRSSEDREIGGGPIAEAERGVTCGGAH